MSFQTRTLVCDTTFCVFGADGQMDAATSDDGRHGLYIADRRVLSLLRIEVESEAMCEVGPAIQQDPLAPIAHWIWPLEVGDIKGSVHLSAAVGVRSLGTRVWVEWEQETRPSSPDGAVASGFTLTLIWRSADDEIFAVKEGTAPPEVGTLTSRSFDLHVQQRAQIYLLGTAQQVATGSGEHPRVSAIHASARARRSRWNAGLPASPKLSGASTTKARSGFMRAYDTACADLALLGLETEVGELTSAGAPWFLAPFGRDSCITAIQTLHLAPDRAIATAEYLAIRQATHDIPELDAEPGKIMHEERVGVAESTWPALYYGSADSTSLWIRLVHEIWTRSRDLPDHAARLRTLGPHITAAVNWIESQLRSGGGYVRFHKRAPIGLDVQSWKDSHDSQRFADGSIASGPIAAVEVQAYAADALICAAALVPWFMSVGAPFATPQDATRWTDLANDLRLRTIDSFTVRCPRRGTFLALALDGHDRVVDSCGSNTGHALWAGLTEVLSDTSQRAELEHAFASTLLSEHMSNGWGIRTMSALDTAYDPDSYHCGSVWPHDTGLCAAGFHRVGLTGERDLVLSMLIDVADQLDGHLPEVIGGATRTEGRPLAPYPASCMPQAWSAGTIPYLMRLAFA